MKKDCKCNMEDCDRNKPDRYDCYMKKNPHYAKFVNETRKNIISERSEREANNEAA